MFGWWRRDYAGFEALEMIATGFLGVCDSLVSARKLVFDDCAS